MCMIFNEEQGQNNKTWVVKNLAPEMSNNIMSIKTSTIPLIKHWEADVKSRVLQIAQCLRILV